MKVLKFGGTSVGSVESILSLKKIVEKEAKENQVVVVVSALGLVLTLAAALPLTVLGIFVVLASTAFLVALFSFIDFILCIARKRCCD